MNANDEITKRDVFKDEKTTPDPRQHPPRLTYRDILSRMFWQSETEWHRAANTNQPTIITVRIK